MFRTRPTSAGHILILTLTAFAAIVILCRTPAQPSNGGSLTFAINLPPSLLGEGAADIISQFDKLGKAVKRKTGYTLKLKKYNNWDQVADALDKGRADLAWIPSYYYARHVEHRKKTAAKPMATYAPNGKITSVTCIYVRKDSGINDMDSLISKRIAFADEGAWVMLSKIFDSQNYPFPPADFFGLHEQVTRESAALALHHRQTDAIVLEDAYIGYIENIVPSFRKETRTIACAPPYTSTPIVRGRKLTGARLKKVKNMLLVMHADNGFKDFRKFFAANKGRWVASKTNAYNDWRALYRDARKKGWLKDYQRLDL